MLLACSCNIAGQQGLAVSATVACAPPAATATPLYDSVLGAILCARPASGPLISTAQFVHRHRAATFTAQVAPAPVPPVSTLRVSPASLVIQPA